MFVSSILFPWSWLSVLYDMHTSAFEFSGPGLRNKVKMFQVIFKHQLNILN